MNQGNNTMIPNRLMKRSAHHRASSWQLALASLFVLLFTDSILASELIRSSSTIATGTRWETEVVEIDSGQPGPVIMIVGGIHGNEPAGAYAAQQISHWRVDRGKIVVVPCVNRPGRQANTRYMPEVESNERDLNRNFPGREVKIPRGELATALWELTLDVDPDWVLDLHEGYEFNVSHEPPEGKSKSVGTTLIFKRDEVMTPVTDHMIEAVNQTIENPERRFVPLGGGPVEGSWVRACLRELGKKGMIVETTFKDQPLSLRAFQHRLLVNEVLMTLDMVDSSQADRLIAENDQTVDVGIFDGAGTSVNGVKRLTSQIDVAENMTGCVIGPQDMNEKVINQFDVLVFPGGSGSRQANDIGVDGRATIRQFVSNGGGCVGICAGAYLVSSYYSWSLKIVDSAVFTGSREIEGVGRKQMWYRGGPTNVDVELTDEGEAFFEGVPREFSVRYQNGPIISPMNDPLLDDYTVLAYFRSENGLYPPQEGTMINTPAIVTAPFGEGRVVSISPHPEATVGLEHLVETSIRWTVDQVMTEQK